MKLKALKTPYHYDQIAFTDKIYEWAIMQRKETQRINPNDKTLQEIECIKNRLNEVRRKRKYYA